MLGAAGFAPVFEERDFGVPALDLVRRSVEAIVAAHEPNPALAVDRHWTMVAANRAVARLVAGAEPSLLRPPVNVLRLSLHPAGLASRIVNLTQWRAHIITRLRRQIDTSDDPTLTDLLEEIRDYPSFHGPTFHGSEPGPHDNRADAQDIQQDMIAIPFRLATIDGVLSFFSTTTLFANPVDITLSELAIEAFLPADAETAELTRRIAQQSEKRPDALGPPAGALA